jgi:peptidoglycan/xylan/chitin deacetylase (PgdA/CDA1 family)
LIVITYHKILNSGNFEKQIQYLIKKFKIGISIQNVAVRKKQLLITADDGDPSFYHNAFPVLKKYNIPAILFVVTDLINTKKPFWWDEVEYYLGKDEGNKKNWELKTWPNSKRESFLEELRGTSVKPLLNYEQLSTAQLKEMQESGITIANHSHTHPMFDHCTREELEKEMEQSISVLEALGFTPDVFAYPNGNYSQKTEVVLKSYGIKKAFLFDHQINNRINFNSLRISRLVVNDTTPMWKFKLILSGWHTKILPVTRGLGKLKKRL